MKYSLFNKVAAPMTGDDFSGVVENNMAQIERCYNLGNAAGYKIIAMSAANGYLGGDSHGVVLTIHATGSALVNGDVGDVVKYEVMLSGPEIARPIAWAKFGQKMVSSEHMSADQMDAVLERTEYAECGVAPGAAGQDQDLRRAVQAQLGFLMHGE
ncbi:MAG: hypothetical protein IT466_08775 [Moraxellaceae bacterium]|nr:hypothetical protein [Moraxellaceae bacterium]